MDYLNKCRLCLNEIAEKNSSVPLYIQSDHDSAKQIDEEVVLMVLYCVSVQIDNITTLPAHICVACFEELKKCNIFKRKCQDSDVKLKKFVAENSVPKTVIQVKQEPGTVDKTIWPLLTPEVTLTEGSGTKDGSSREPCTSLNSSLPDSEKPKVLEEIKKIRVKKLTELNGNCDKKSNVVTEHINVKSCEEEFDEDTPLSDILQGLEKKESKRGKYQCSYCEETFRRQVAKQVHEKEHKVLYKCVLCYESFHTHLKLQKHRADVHNEDPYCCSFCSTSFADVHSWTDHLKKNHVCCSKCRSYFKTQDDLDSHTCLKKALLSKGCTPEELQNRIQYDFPRCHAKKQKFSTEKKKYTPKKNYYQLKKMRLLAAAQSTEFVTVHSSSEDKFITEDNKQRGPFPCFRCDKDFTDKGSLICHQAVAHPGQPIDNTQRPPKKSVLFCKFCLLFFRHVSDMNSHICQNSMYLNAKRAGAPPPPPPLRPISEPLAEASMPFPQIKKTFGSFIDTMKGDSLSSQMQDSIEKKPVVPKLLPTTSVSKMFNEPDSRVLHPTYTPSITKIFNHIPPPPAQVLIKEERVDLEDEEGEMIEDLSSQNQHLKCNKRNKDYIQPPESVFKLNPNLLATLGIRQDTSL